MNLHNSTSLHPGCAARRDTQCLARPSRRRKDNPIVMIRIFKIAFFLNLTIAYGQARPESYRFSRDIFAQIQRDTFAWKYQVGAADLSFVGRYADLLKIWDKEGAVDTKATKEDSLLFVKSQKLIAKDYIIGQAKQAQILIINEAHHIPQHRVFTKSLLQDLYSNGYRYLGLETLMDTGINRRKFPVIASGYYTQEPEFGAMVAEALTIGFTLFGYEASGEKNGKDREIEQAANIQQFIASNPAGKVLIHCGYAHAFENDYPAWGKAMAGRLKDNLKTDPLTVDQTMFLEKSDVRNNHLFIKLNNTKQPIVLMEENGVVFKGLSGTKQTDIVIIHPQTQYINGRADWQIQGKEKYIVPPARIDQYKPCLILAYRNNEFEEDGVPADVIEFTQENPFNELYLPKGIYTIVLKDSKYNIVDKYKVVIGSDAN